MTSSAIIESSKSTDPKGPIVFFGTPAYDGLRPRYVQSLFDATRELNRRGFRVQHYFAIHCSIVTNARCEILGAFHASGADWFVGIDNDICWPHDLVPRMIELGEPMTCAAVPYRKIDVDAIASGGDWSDAIQFNVEPTSREEMLAMPAKNGFRRVTDVGTAFYVARRDAFLAMARRYHDLEIEVTGMQSWALYHQLIEDRKLVGEDRSFFRRWHRLGGQTWCIEDAEIVHTGLIDVGGNFLHHLRGTPDPARKWVKGAMHGERPARV